MVTTPTRGKRIPLNLFKTLPKVCRRLVEFDSETSNLLFEVFEDWDEHLRHADSEELKRAFEEPQP